MKVIKELPPKASFKTAVGAVFNPMPFYIINQKLYPKIFSSSLLSFSAYVIHSPDFIKRVLQENSKNYTKGGKYGFIRLLLGNGLLTSDGEHWLKHRKIIHPSFHKKNLEESRKVMIDESFSFASRQKEGTVINVNKEMADLTTNIVGKSLFGLSSEKKINFLRSELDKCQKYGHSLLRMPINYPDWILKVPFWRKLATAIKNVHSSVRETIDERIMAGRKEAEQNDLLDLMLALKYEDTGEPMSAKQIQDEVLTLIVAGHETTTLGLSWTIYELARNQEIQEKVRQEMKAKGITAETLSFEKLSELQYLEMVINESLRLYPPAYLFARTATEEDYLGPYYVPPGGNVIINLYGLHRNPEYWSDPDVFNPDRFINFDPSGLHKFAFLPFGAGPRGCIGTHFAMAEMKIIIISLLSSYQLYPANKGAVVPKPLFTLNPSEPVKISLKLNAHV